MSEQNRKINLVDHEIQGALAKRMAFHWLCFLSVALFVSAGLQWLSNPFTSIGDLLSGLWANQAPILLTMLCLIPVFIYDSIKLSNKLVGPMVRIRRAIRSLADGESAKPISLRKGDFWQDVAKDLNTAIDNYQQSKSSSKSTEELALSS